MELKKRKCKLEEKIDNYLSIQDLNVTVKFLP